MLAGSGLADKAVGNLPNEGRGKLYNDFSLLFLTAKARWLRPSSAPSRATMTGECLFSGARR